MRVLSWKPWPPGEIPKDILRAAWDATEGLDEYGMVSAALDAAGPLIYALAEERVAGAIRAILDKMEPYLADAVDGRDTYGAVGHVVMEYHAIRAVVVRASTTTTEASL